MIKGDFKGGKGAGKTPRKGSCCLNKGGQDIGPFQGCLLSVRGAGEPLWRGAARGRSPGKGLSRGRGLVLPGPEGWVHVDRTTRPMLEILLCESDGGLMSGSIIHDFCVVLVNGFLS